MQHTITLATAVALAGTAACRLDPLVDDVPGASANILPSTATVDRVDVNPELTNQITLNDSLDTRALAMNNGIIARSTTGVAGNGDPVAFWTFGEAERAPAPIYIFGTGDPATPEFQRIDHPPLVDAVPGDGEYEPIHTVYRVAVTDKYAGQKITTSRALADAIDLGLVEPPLAIKQFINWPIVRPGLRLDVGPGGPANPTAIYGRGYLLDSFPLGGSRGQQPNPFGLLPTSQVSFLRAQKQGAYDTSRPIFQASVPTAAPGAQPNYTPVSIVVNVDLVGMDPLLITKDSDLFMRGANGAITATTASVLTFTVTGVTLDIQMQFTEGQP